MPADLPRGELIRSRFDAMSAGKAYLAATVLKMLYHAISIEEKLTCTFHAFLFLANTCLILKQTKTETFSCRGTSTPLKSIVNIDAQYSATDNSNR
jgi:hypothetical protein